MSAPAGCHFHPRCPHVQQICREEYPPLVQTAAGAGRAVACHFAAEIALEGIPTFHRQSAPAE